MENYYADKRVMVGRNLKWEVFVNDVLKWNVDTVFKQDLKEVDFGGVLRNKRGSFICFIFRIS